MLTVRSDPGSHMLCNTSPAEVWVPMAAGWPLSLGCTTGSAWDSAFSSACFWAGGCRQGSARLPHSDCSAGLACRTLLPPENYLAQEKHFSCLRASSLGHTHQAAFKFLKSHRQTAAVTQHCLEAGLAGKEAMQRQANPCQAPCVAHNQYLACTTLSTWTSPASILPRPCPAPRRTAQRLYSPAAPCR